MKNQYTKYYFAFFYLCSTIALIAQPGAGNDTSNLEGADTPAAPINDYLWVLALIGLLFVFMKLKNLQNKKIAIKFFK
jgi:hypothetical protein